MDNIEIENKAKEIRKDIEPAIFSEFFEDKELIKF